MDQQSLRQSNPSDGKLPGKRPRFLLRLALFLLSAVLVIGAVAVVVFRDRLNLDSIKRWIHYRTLSISDSGRAESFPYDGSLNDTFAVLDGDLLVCSPNAISLYSSSGTRYVNQAVQMQNPVVDSNGSLAVVYDAGGSSLYVLGQRELIWQGEDFDSILSARLNRDGYLTVVTQSSGYRGVVTVCDSTYTPLMSVNVSSAFVLDAALSDDGHTLAILTMGQQDGVVQSTLSLYGLNTGDSGQFTPDVTTSLGAVVALDTKHTQDQVWMVTDQGLTIADHAGQTVTADWSSLYLKRYTLDGDGFAVALLGRYRAGSQAQLWVTDEQGQTHTLEIDQQVLSLSAAGRYIAVLTGDRLDIYTDTLELYASLEGTQGARSALALKDGSAILISDDTVSFYIP
ncbi:MAG TPA: hypothetical protein IAC21_02155 [Candidatus Enterenecus merdae]|nr:hypothetical protein [Candidatus Enterenecus merdae]